MFAGVHARVLRARRPRRARPLELVAEVWTDDDAFVLRKRWDVNLGRLRGRLREGGVRTDLVRAAGTGQVELVLRRDEHARGPAADRPRRSQRSRLGAATPPARPSATAHHAGPRAAGLGLLGVAAWAGSLPRARPLARAHGGTRAATTTPSRQLAREVRITAGLSTSIITV